MVGTGLRHSTFNGAVYSECSDNSVHTTYEMLIDGYIVHSLTCILKLLRNTTNGEYIMHQKAFFCSDCMVRRFSQWYGVPAVTCTKEVTHHPHSCSLQLSQRGWRRTGYICTGMSPAHTWNCCRTCRASFLCCYYHSLRDSRYQDITEMGSSGIPRSALSLKCGPYSPRPLTL